MPAHLIVEEGTLRGLIFNLDVGEEWIVGRDPSHSQFVLEDDAAPRKAVRLFRQENQIYIENISRTHPALVNGEEIVGPVPLNEGDKVQIGHTTFLFSEKELSLESDKNENHDTIFEDLNPEESQLPFHLIPETPILLKVISGPNAGAEIGIEAGRSYTLGKDPELCDIVFQDLSVSREHARITVNADSSMEIEDLGSKNGTVLNGSLIEEKTPLTTQDMVAIGTTVFLLIDREEPQETIYSPVSLGYETSRSEEENTEPETPSENEAEKVDWKQKPIPSKYLFLGAACVTIFLIIFISFFSLFKASPVEMVHNEPSSVIQKALEKYEDLQFSFNPASGKLFLVGHVLNGIDAEEMRFRIQEIPFIQSVEENVVIDESVNRMMNDVISENPMFRGVTFQSPKAGRFIAIGYIDTNAQSMQLSDYLAVNFPYLDRLDNRVVVGEILNAQIIALLQSKGFGSLTFQYTNGEVVLSGNYSNKMEKELKDTIQQLNTIRGVSGVKNYTVATKPSASAIDISNQYQLTGISTHDGKGYNVILNGKIYTLGNLIDGMHITEIDPTMILLEKDGIKYKINYVR